MTDEITRWKLKWEMIYRKKSERSDCGTNCCPTALEE